MPRFVINGKTYQSAAIDALTLRQLLRLESETQELGTRWGWRELQAMLGRISDKDPEEAQEDPDFMWFVAVLIWSSRVNSGEAITFADAVDFPFVDFKAIPDPDDHKAAEGPQQPRSASGRGGASGDKKPKKKAASASQ